MENVRIAILDTYGKVLAFLDNTAPKALHYFDDELHTYIKGSAATYSFTADAKHEDAQYLAEGNKLSFIYDRKEYYFTIMQVEKDEYTISATAFSCSFELLNDVVDANSYSHPLRSFEEYLDLFDADRVVEVGRNEVSTIKLPGSFEEETLLARLFSLAELFDAEIELVPVLAKNYSLEKLILNIYREHDDSHQGIGQDRRELTLRYGKNIAGIKKTSDITELFTAIRPEGKDGLSILSIEHTAKDANGEIEFYTAKDDRDIYAVQAAKRFPAFSRGKEGYIWKNVEYDETDASSLFLTALRDLEEGCVPKVTYEIDVSYCEETDRVSIGDTVSVEDAGFQPTLYLSARVTEQVISFTDPSRNKVTFSNIKEEQSQLSPETIKRMQALIDASKTYACSIITDNGIVFKNGEGTTTLTASVMDGGKDLTDTLTITWYKDGEALLVGKSLAVSAADVTGKAVYRYEAVENGVVRGKCEVTVIDVSDGQDGEKSTSYKMQVNAWTVKRSAAGEFTPSNIIVTGFSQTGNGEQETHYGVYEIEFDGSTVSSRGYSFYRAIPEGTESIVCRMRTYEGALLCEAEIPIAQDGTDGADATAYRMLVNALAIGKTASGSYKQSTITVQGRRQVGSGSFTSYACRFKVETTTSANLSSASWTSRYTSSSNTSSYIYTIPSGVTGIRCSMYAAGGTTTLLDQVIIPIIADGTNASLPAVEDLSSGITASGTYVDTTKQVEKLAYRYGKVVQAHLTFYAKTALSSAVTLFSGLPGMNNAMQFVGMNYTKNTPVIFAVRETGEFQKWYAGDIAAGDLVRVGFTYICQ